MSTKISVLVDVVSR